MSGDLLDRTLSLCPTCHDTIPAAIRATGAGIVMDKRCPRHGPATAVIGSDRRTYERLASAPRKVTPPPGFAGSRDLGCPSDCGLCSAHEQHTCLAILEITSRCDLGCPVCLAGALPAGSDLAPDAAETALRRLIELEGGVAPLQLSGGEPTQHPELAAIVRRAAALGFRKVEIDSNGLALARDPALALRLREAGLTGVYLQMDSLDARAVLGIRGQDLVEAKQRAIEHCRRAGLGVVLSVTVVPGLNDGELWDLVRFGMRERLGGVNFQPVALSGRFPAWLVAGPERFTLGHFLHAIEAQSRGALRADELAPIPCPDTRCGVMAYALVRDGRLEPLARLVGQDALFDSLADLADWDDLLRRLRTAGSASCGCDGPCGPPAGLGEALVGAECFAVGCHAMMDAWSFDYERAKRCCVHELTPEGTLVPFCLYNIKYRAPRPGRLPVLTPNRGVAAPEEAPSCPR